MVEGSMHNSFMHSLLAKGRLLYTHDRDDRRLCARGCSEIGERDTQLQLLRAGDARAAVDLQGAQVVRHARRPRLHRAVDSLRRDAAGADRGDRRAPARRPRGDPAGDDAEPGVLQDDLHRPAERARRRGRASQAALDADRRLHRRARADAVRAGARAPARGRRSAVVHRDRGPLQAELRRRAA